MGDFYIYEHWRPDKDCCFYVGKGRGDRAFRLRRRTVHHKNIVRKLARAGLAIEVRIIISGLTEMAAFDAEISQIKHWQSRGVKLSNLTKGGEGSSGYRHTESTRAKMKKTTAQIEQIRIRQTGKKASPETREKIRLVRTGTSLSEATKSKLSVALNGRVFTLETRAKISAGLIGRVVSDKTRALWSAQRRGRKIGPRSFQTRQKISASLKGHPVSEETRAKIAAKAIARHRSS